MAKKRSKRTKARLRRWARKGGLIGGRIRAKTLSPERRREIALAGATARWNKATIDPAVA